jgi:protein-disulfide isomerase
VKVWSPLQRIESCGPSDYLDIMNAPLPLALTLVAALSVAGCQDADDAAFGAKVRSYLLANPEVLEEMAAKLQEKQQLKQQAAAKDALAKFRQQLERDPRDLVFNPGGSITVVEFFDYNCGYCKVAAPDVVKLIKNNPDVRFVFKDFAFQTQDSITAAKMVLTPTARPKGLELYTGLMAQKPLNPETVDRVFKAAGVDPAQARAGAKDPAIERQIAETHDLARALGIDGTPAFVVGDQIIHGADLNALKAAIETARAGPMKRPSSPT